MSNRGTTEPPPDSVAEDLREFLRSYRAGAVPLEDVARGYVAGADVSRPLEDLSDEGWSTSLVELLTASPQSAAELIESLPFDEGDKQELRRLRDRYGPSLGQLLLDFGATRLGPLQDPISALRISPSYCPDQRVLALRVQMFSGSALSFTTVDTPGSFLWLAGRLIDHSNGWLEWSVEKGLEVRKGERARLRERSQELAKEAQRLADIAEKFDKLDEEVTEPTSSADQ